jgi:hypothetical protein
MVMPHSLQRKARWTSGITRGFPRCDALVVGGPRQ